MNSAFQWNGSIASIAKAKLKLPESALFLANEAKRLMDPYVPAKNLILAQNVRVYTEKSPLGGVQGIVHYRSPYAHYQYAGILYVSSLTGSSWSRGEYKVPTRKKLNHDKFRHPLATSEWDKAMLKARRKDMERSLKNYLKARI